MTLASLNASSGGTSGGTSSGIDGYYTYTGIVSDLAGNAAPAVTRTVLVDRTSPIMGAGIAVPQTIIGGQAAAFATSATDNLDLLKANFTAPQPGGGTMLSFQVTILPTNISNCPAAGCAGGAQPVNPTAITLSAAASGSENTTSQFLNPFTQVQFYYQDPNTGGMWQLAGVVVAPVVTDNNTATARTLTWTLSPPFDPPATLGGGAPLRLIAIGVTASGDALARP